MEHARILIVEDEHIVAKDIESTLRSLGYVVVGRAKSGEEALFKASELSPHLVLMDIRLNGEMNGIEAAKQIRERLEMPIVFLTAYSDKKTLEQAKQAKPSGYVIKPFAEHDLYTAIEIGLSRHVMDADLVKAEKKYRDLYENAPDGYITLDARGNIADVNETFARMMGLPKEKILRGNVGQFVHETSKDDYVQMMERIAKKIPDGNVKLNLVRHDAQILPTLINAKIPLNAAESRIASRLDIRDLSGARLDAGKGVQENVIRMSRKLALTENEKKVFLGLVGLPHCNTVELSKALKIKRSTIAAIKNKLQKETYYRSYRVPNYHVLGCELVIVVAATLSQSSQNKALASYLYEELLKIAETVHLLGTERNFLCVLVSKNITEFKRAMDELITAYKTNNIITSIDIQYFPYEISEIRNFHDYTGTLAGLFDLPLPMRKQRKGAAQHKKFTRKEKSIYDALVTHASLNDSEIAAKTGLARPSISQVRTRLLEGKFLHEINVPDALKLKTELIAHYAVRMPRNFDTEQSDKLKNQMGSFPSTFFFVNAASETSSLHLYSDYSTFEEEHNKIVSNFQNGEKNSFQYALFPVTQLSVNAIQFAPLLRKMLGSA